MIRIQNVSPPGFALCRRFCQGLDQTETDPDRAFASELRGLFETFETLEHYPDASSTPQFQSAQVIRLKDPANV